MKKNFVINILLLLFLNLLIKPLWILMDIEVQNHIGNEEYGTYFALFNLSIILNILLDAGTSSYNNRQIAIYPHLSEKIVSHIIPLRLLLGAVFLVILIVCGLILKYTATSLWMLFFIGINQFLLASWMYIRSVLQGKMLFKSDSISSVSDRLVMILLLFYFLYFSPESFNLNWFIGIQTLGYIVAIAISLMLLGMKGGMKIRPKFKVSFSLHLLKKSYPFALLLSMMIAYSYIDSIMLERMLNNGEWAAGIYAQSFRILSALTNFSYLFSILLLPLFSQIISKKENPMELVQLSGSLLILPAIFISISCALHSHTIIDLLYEGNATETLLSANVFKGIMLCFIPVSIINIYGTLLIAGGEMKIFNRAAALGIVVNVTGNLIALPLFGAIGAAVVSLITQSIVAAITLIYARKKYRLSPSTKNIGAYVLTLFCFGTAVLVLQQIHWHWLLQIVVAICAGMLAAVFTGSIKTTGVKKLFTAKR